MNYKYINERIKEILYTNGVIILSSEDDCFLLDSISYVSIIIDIENTFNVCISPEKIIPKHEINLKFFVDMVTETLDNGLL